MHQNTHRMALVVATMFIAPNFGAGQAPQDTKPVAAAAKQVYDETADANKDIVAALARANRDGTSVLIQWGANWCGWCVLLHGTCAKNPEISKELREEYEVVLVDIGRFDKHLELATKYGADFKSKGVPYLTVLDASGKVLANQETGTLELPEGTTPRGHDPAKVMAFLKAHQAAPLVASDVLADGVAAAKSQGKLVFLHFGAPWCGWCHKLDDWMARPEIAAILAKAFVDVKIDTQRMTGGQSMLETHSQGKNGGIPWLEFLDGDGKSLVNSTGPEGNTGFPAAPAELEWFGQMLRNSGAKLTPEEVAALLASLQAKPAGT